VLAYSADAIIESAAFQSASPLLACAEDYVK